MRIRKQPRVLSYAYSLPPPARGKHTSRHTFSLSLTPHAARSSPLSAARENGDLTRHRELPQWPR